MIMFETGKGQGDNKIHKARRHGRMIMAAVFVFLFLAVSGIQMFVLAAVGYPFIKYALKLDLSQDYREARGINSLVFWDKWSNTAYYRTFWGLKKAGGEVEFAERNEDRVPWTDNRVYDVSGSGRLAAYYDAEYDVIVLCDLQEYDLQECDEYSNKAAFAVEYQVDRIVISPDEQYIFYREIEYGVYGGYSTDEEYCYYRAIDIDTKKIITIYEGYREWYDIRAIKS